VFFIFLIFVYHLYVAKRSIVRHNKIETSTKHHLLNCVTRESLVDTVSNQVLSCNDPSCLDNVYCY